jgi:hypothetical protein
MMHCVEFGRRANSNASLFYKGVLHFRASSHVADTHQVAVAERTAFVLNSNRGPLLLALVAGPVLPQALYAKA